MSKLEKLYCVYHHLYQDEIFYVGMGLNGRQFATTSRNDSWNEFVNKLPGRKYEVKVVGLFLDKIEASAMENSDIQKYSPLANGNPRNYMRQRPRASIMIYLDTYPVLKKLARTRRMKVEDLIATLVQS